MRMRVISGELGGRFFESPGSSTTHPMSERVRGSMFNILGDVSGLSVLEPFAGSGALSFEALSRGAKSALLLERDKSAQRTIEGSIKSLGIEEKARLVKANCRMWSEKNQNKKFDLLLVDPPYHDMQLSTVALLIKHLQTGGRMILSYQGRGAAPTVNGVVVVDTRLYGDAALAFYQLTD